jgi:hypothetical protein
MRYACILALVGGCIEYDPSNEPPPPPAQPPGEDDDGQGDPPDWNNCFGGWRGQWSNLQVHHPLVEPRPRDPPAPTSPEELDFWDSPTREDYERSIDHGLGYWPVDEGLEGDPAYYAVYWHAWLRAWSDTTFSFQLASSDDSWVYVNNGPIAEKPGIQEFVRDQYDVYLEAGQYPIEVWYVHRASDLAGFSFRQLSGDVSICYPDFEGDEE